MMESKQITEIKGNQVTVTQDNAVTGRVHIEVQRNDGSVEKKEMPMESFTQRFLEVIASATTNNWLPNPDIQYRSYTSGSLAMEIQEFTAQASSTTTSNYGMLIGSGSSAVSLDDYTLDEYSTSLMARSQLASTYDESNLSATFTRTFENVSGGPLDVTEVGLTGTRNLSNSLGSVMLLTRDIFSTITLADGEYISVTLEFDFSSMNRNFGASIFGALYYEGGKTPINSYEIDGGTDSVISTGDDLYRWWQLQYPDEEWNGLVVGRGVGSHSTSRIDLRTRITSGTGTNQLIYGPNIFGRPTNDGTTVTLPWIRSVTNLSGADITVTEMGIIQGTSTLSAFLQWSTELASSVTIADGETYVFQFNLTTAL